ncbi:hypothetical protein VX037_01400 [Gordonia sp. Z-3]|nr:MULTISPECIES: hypothetical protein [unclassified Gordonia (in: high G+C Gram-positive bacteria)]MED5799689.1 hypothetical protein [Gordonia sp. Z-3]
MTAFAGTEVGARSTHRVSGATIPLEIPLSDQLTDAAPGATPTWDADS